MLQYLSFGCLLCIKPMSLSLFGCEWNKVVTFAQKLLRKLANEFWVDTYYHQMKFKTFVAFQILVNFVTYLSNIEQQKVQRNMCTRELIKILNRIFNFVCFACRFFVWQVAEFYHKSEYSIFTIEWILQAYLPIRLDCMYISFPAPLTSFLYSFAACYANFCFAQFRYREETKKK